MKLFEYQTKELFVESGIPVPKGKLVDRDTDINTAIGEVGLPCVLKAQVLQAGRGKAGLIQFASTKDEAREKATKIFSSHTNIRRLLIEEKLNIEKEFYLAITINPVLSSILVMASLEGGVDVEDIAKKSPEKIIKEEIDIFKGLLPFQARNVMFGLGLKGNAFKQGLKILSKMFDIFCRYDAELLEINPLVLASDGKLIAADAKLIIDDNSSFRQKRFTLTRDYFESDIEYEASEKSIPYLQFDGTIGLMCAGAGLTNTVYDLINYYGGSVANYLEFGGPNYTRAVQAMELTLKNKPKVILIVTFGTIARADVMAQGIADAIRKLKPNVPIVTAIRGTGEEEADKILRGIGLEPLKDTESAVKKAVELAAGGSAK
ncbi:acetate--CoA ligase family protein [bacterium]|nr:acetate--CoA ligase family protein [bacterium]